MQIEIIPVLGSRIIPVPVIGIPARFTAGALQTEADLRGRLETGAPVTLRR